MNNVFYQTVRHLDVFFSSKSTERCFAPSVTEPRITAARLQMETAGSAPFIHYWTSAPRLIRLMNQ